MADAITTHGTYFICRKTNRILQLRGVSLSGSSKLPTNLPSHHPETDEFFDHANVTYVGRPFPLSDMDEHLSRIREWGFRIVRLVVTWEALEHAGWQKYDTEYIDYLRTIVEALPRYGLSCIIDAHQDVFSRLTGGSGAPGWVLSAIGIELQNLQKTHAAHLHSLALLASDPPPSVWPTGYQKLAASTCNTIFWAGDIFAWKRTAPDGSGKGLSTWLQEAMCNAFGELADALEGLPAVLGFEPMNEPHRGYIELHNMYAFDPNTDLQLGYHTSAIQSFVLGDGYSLKIPYWKPSFPHPTEISHYVTVNEAGERAWEDGRPCIWREHGVWEWDSKGQKPLVMRQSYFERDPRTGRRIEWYNDCWYPFLKRFRERIVAGKKERLEWFTFAAGIPNEFTPLWTEPKQPDNLISAPHFYDLHSLFTKSLGNITFNVQGLSRGMFPLQALYYGRAGIRNNYALQLSNVVKHSDESTGKPCIIGEIGVPFDMNGFSASRTNDWRWQERQMDALCTGMERCLTNYIMWNYNPENEDQWGDAWYGENFSLYSLSLKEKTGDGGRCVDAFQRPYAIATPGRPLKSDFDMFTLSYVYEYANYGGGEKQMPELQSQITEIYLPRRRYKEAFEEKQVIVQISDGEWRWNEDEQTLSWTKGNHTPGYRHTLKITVVDQRFWKPQPPSIDLKDSPLRWLLGVLLAMLAAFLAYKVSS